MGIGVGAVSTVGANRWENSSGLVGYMAAGDAMTAPPADRETIIPALRLWEQAMLGLRLDTGVSERAVSTMLDHDGLERMIDGGLVERSDKKIRLTVRGRHLGDAVTAELLKETPEREVAERRELAPVV